MNCLLICEIAHGLSAPDFGSVFVAHLNAKHHPQLHAASLTAWNLLEIALRRNGQTILPQTDYLSDGKPVWRDSPLHFSLSHSGNLAAALLCEAPCGVDIELVRGEADVRQIKRCLNAQEQSLGCDFYECWTKKECLAKLDGRGMPAHPNQIDSLNPIYAPFFQTQRISDNSGQVYAMAALCMNQEPIHIQKIKPEELL